VLAAASQLLIAACSGGSTDAPAQPLVKARVRSVAITPSQPITAAGRQIQLRAIVDADPGADTTVRWSADSSDAGWLLPNGLVQACYGPGLIRVRATSLADTTKSATTFVATAEATLKWFFVAGYLLRAGVPYPPGVAADVLLPDSVAGDVDAVVSYSGWYNDLRCHALRRVDVRLIAADMDTLIDRAVFSPPVFAGQQIFVRIHSLGFPSGRYTLRAIGFVDGVSNAVTTDQLTLTIKNP
jgi:hypothetical protein